MDYQGDKTKRHEVINIRPIVASEPLELEVIPAKISGGFPNPAADHFKQAINIADIVIQNQTATYMGYAWNDSMEPLIYEGAILIIDKALTVRNGHYIVGSYDGEWFMKRYWKESNKVTLHSENPRYDPVIVCLGLQFSVFGKITKVIQSL